MTREPASLSRGKAFHRQVQADWQLTAEGAIRPEHTVRLLAGPMNGGRIRRGRLDIFVDELGDFVTVVEIKGTDWSKIKPANISRNLSSHVRQVWRYVEKFLDGDGTSVCAGIIYPRAPADPQLRARIESYLNDYGLQVVWYHD